MAAKHRSFFRPITSQDDIAALKAIAEANPLNSDLQNFISNKDYLKDRGSNDGYNVGVTWNTESTSRVKSFFIDDGRTQTVTTMDVSALSGLEQLDLQNTRLKSLDLSTLTKLRSLSLYGNDSLTWFTVKLPNSLPENFWMNGYTTIMAGTPVDGNNAYAAAGTEIDLSAYATVGGVKSVYQWYLIDRATGKRTKATMQAVSGKTVLSYLKESRANIISARSQTIITEIGVWRHQGSRLLVALQTTPLRTSPD